MYHWQLVVLLDAVSVVAAVVVVVVAVVIVVVAIVVAVFVVVVIVFLGVVDGREMRCVLSPLLKGGQGRNRLPFDSGWDTTRVEHSLQATSVSRGEKERRGSKGRGDRREKGGGKEGRGSKGRGEREESKAGRRGEKKGRGK